MATNVKIGKLYEWQKPVYDAVANDNGAGLMYVVKAKRQVGKSIVAEVLLLHYAFRRAGSISCCIEPTQSQCRRVFKQIVSAIGGTGSPLIVSANATLLEIEFTNGSQIIFKSAEMDESALRGLTVSYGLLVIDEAAFIDKETFEVLYPAVDATNSPVLLISTPLFCSGEFYERYTRGLAGDARVQVFDWSTYDTSALLPPDKLEYYRQTISPLKFQSEYLGQFIKEGSYLFGDFVKCIKGFSTKAPVYAGIDWGAHGTDSSVLIMMDEDKAVTSIKRWTDVDSVDLVEMIAAEINRFSSLQTVQVEKNSIGDVYFDMLKRKVRKGLLRGFITTNESKRRIIEELIKAVQTGEITLPNDAELIKQMQHLGATKTPGGKITYEGMDNVHDDHPMALAICLDLYKDANKKFSIGFA